MEKAGTSEPLAGTTEEMEGNPDDVPVSLLFVLTPPITPFFCSLELSVTGGIGASSTVGGVAAE